MIGDTVPSLEIGVTVATLRAAQYKGQYFTIHKSLSANINLAEFQLPILISPFDCFDHLIWL